MHPSSNVLRGIAAPILLLLSLGASTALAKEGVSVNLSAPLPRDAAPGEVVPALFTLEAIVDDQTSPLRGASPFLRLYGPTGATTEAIGVEQRTAGLYKAMIEIPAGGIARGEFGIHGTAKAADGTVVASDIIWPYDGVLVTAAAPPPVDPKTYQLPGAKPHPATTPATSAGTDPHAGGLDLRLGGLAVGALTAVAVGAVLVGRRRRLQGAPA